MDHIGIDLHKRESQIYILVEDGEIIERRIRTEAERFAAVLGDRPRARILIEASTDSEWVARGLEALGHEVIVAARTSRPCMRRARARSRPTGVMPAPWPRQACSAPTAPPIGSPIPSVACGAASGCATTWSTRARATSRSSGIRYDGPQVGQALAPANKLVRSDNRHDGLQPLPINELRLDRKIR